MKSQIFFFFILMTLSVNLNSQIPNSGFENWTNMGSYYNPDSWSCLNSKTTLAGVYTCERGTPGNPGNYYLMLTSKTVTGIGVAPGIAASGLFDQTTLQPISGFAFNQRPANLTGSWQHMIFGSSQGFVDVKLTRWDAGMNMRMPVANAHFVLTGMEMSWNTFTIPLTYTDGKNPDSCMIVIAASGSVPANGDYIYIDNLAFSGSVAGLTSTEQNLNDFISPNPASRFILLDVKAMNIDEAEITIKNSTGDCLITQLIKQNQQLDISHLSNGIYFIEIRNGLNVRRQIFSIIN